MRMLSCSIQCRSAGNTLVARPVGLGRCQALVRAVPKVRNPSVKAMNMLGFDFGEDPEEKEADLITREVSSAMGPTPVRKAVKVSSLGTVAASLLVYSQVMKGAVGEAFLAALSSSIKYQAPSKDILGAYARFYSLLQAAGNDAGWEDYVLDQILFARDNAFARAVAQTGKLPAGTAILKAAAYDLDVLQQLCIPMKNLAEYIGDAAPVAGPYWVDAASSASMKAPAKLGESGPQVAMNMSANPPYILAPPTSDELTAWKAAIAGKVDWSEAVPILQQYYATHGFGITSRNSALRWSKGAFEEGSEGNLDMPVLQCLESAQEALADNTRRFCEGLPAQHVLMAGPSGTGKSWLLWESTLAAGKSRGVRVVDVGSSEVNNILEVARGAGRYPRVRFILVADNISFPLRGGGLASDLLAGLSGTGGAGWPSNCLLYMGATSDSTISISDPLVSRFGLFVTTNFLSDAEYVRTLTEIAEGGQGPGPEEGAAAVVWAKQRGGLTLRNAAMFLRSAGMINGVAAGAAEQPCSAEDIDCTKNVC